MINRLDNFSGNLLRLITLSGIRIIYLVKYKSTTFYIVLQIWQAYREFVNKSIDILSYYYRLLKLEACYFMASLLMFSEY